MSRRLRSPWAVRFRWWWPLPAALAVIAVQQGLRWVGWMRLGDAAATAGRLVWPILVVGWPLLVAIGMIVWQRRRRTRAASQLQRDDDEESPRQHPERQRRVLLGLTVTAAGLLMLVAVLAVLPVLLVPAGAIAEDKELYKARNDVRGTLVQVLAGGLVATGLVFTARTLDLNRSGQVTERFTRAVEQLGQRELAKLDVRLGGIYALERIARDSAPDLPTVVEVLCAHVREYSPWPPRLPGQGYANLTRGQLRELPHLQTRAPEVQAVLTVLGRLPDADPSRSIRARTVKPVRRILTQTDLRRAYLRGAHLKEADLSGAHLEGAYLRYAHLEGANLHDAHLEGANLHDAHLEGANLRASLDGAWLRDAHLEGADLRYADLGRAYLVGAHLEEADLRDLYLGDADLGGARLERARANAGTVWPSAFDWRAAGVRKEEDEEPR